MGARVPAGTRRDPQGPLDCSCGSHVYSELFTSSTPQHPSRNCPRDTDHGREQLTLSRPAGRFLQGAGPPGPGSSAKCPAGGLPPAPKCALHPQTWPTTTLSLGSQVPAALGCLAGASRGPSGAPREYLFPHGAPWSRGSAHLQTPGPGPAPSTQMPERCSPNFEGTRNLLRPPGSLGSRKHAPFWAQTGAPPSSPSPLLSLSPEGPWKGRHRPPEGPPRPQPLLFLIPRPCPSLAPVQPHGPQEAREWAGRRPPRPRAHSPRARGVTSSENSPGLAPGVQLPGRRERPSSTPPPDAKLLPREAAPRTRTPAGGRPPHTSPRRGGRRPVLVLTDRPCAETPAVSVFRVPR